MSSSLLISDEDTEALQLIYGLPPSFLPIKKLFNALRSLLGTRIPNPGLDQERNRGGALHRLVCTATETPLRDRGMLPDVEEQLLEVKLQTSPTIDLGLLRPDSSGPLPHVYGLTPADLRYAVFFGAAEGDRIALESLVMTTGADFWTPFEPFGGKGTNSKLQIPLPSSFFD